MKFLIRSTTPINRGFYYTAKAPLFRSLNKKEAKVYTLETLPLGLFNRNQAILVLVWPEDEAAS